MPTDRAPDGIKGAPAPTNAPVLRAGGRIVPTPRVPEVVAFLDAGLRRALDGATRNPRHPHGAIAGVIAACRARFGASQTPPRSAVYRRAEAVRRKAATRDADDEVAAFIDAELWRALDAAARPQFPRGTLPNVVAACRTRFGADRTPHVSIVARRADVVRHQGRRRA